MESDFAIFGNRLAVLLFAFSGLCSCRSQQLSVSRLPEFDHSRRRASLFQLVWLHDYHSWRDAGGTAGPAAVCRVFLCASRDIWLCVLCVLVLREFSVHWHVYGGRARTGFAASGFRRPRLGDFVRAMGIAGAGPENWRDDAGARLDGNDRRRWLAGLADVPQRTSERECACARCGALTLLALSEEPYTILVD